jgi:predicted adenine nucleotide alpha hydrolase (AANH) superfamily ATPase
LHSTEQFQKEEEQTERAITCFNHRLQEIQLDSRKLYEKTEDSISGSILLKLIGQVKRK